MATKPKFIPAAPKSPAVAVKNKPAFESFSRDGFDMSRRPPVYCTHDFVAHSGGMDHHIDGKLRASVPENGIEDYLKNLQGFGG